MALVYQFHRKYGVATTLYFGIEIASGTNPPGVPGASLRDGVGSYSLGELKISKDGSAMVSTTNLPTQLGGSGSVPGYSLVLTAAELSADYILITGHELASTALTGAIIIIIETFIEASKLTIDATNLTNQAAVTLLGVGTGEGLKVTGGVSGHGANFVAGTTTGNGMRVIASGGSNDGLVVQGVGTGDGVDITGGGTGHGINCKGGSSSGSGAQFIAQLSGHGIIATGLGASNTGIIATGPATGTGIYANGGNAGIHGVGTDATSYGIIAQAGGAGGAGFRALGVTAGHGIHALGGSTSGDGIRAEGAAGNSPGLNAVGQGSAAGVLATGGATGHGIQGVGGATSGAGIRGTGTAGNSPGGQLVGQGSAAGLAATGGATGNGALLTGGATSGAGLRAAGAAGNGSGAEFVANGSGFGLDVSTGDLQGRILLHSIREGTAQAGAATSITLDAGASANDDFFNNQLCLLTGGTGAGQARLITDYVGATKVATVATWVVNPDNTSVFMLLPATSLTASDVWAVVEGAEPTTPIPSNASFGVIFQHIKRRFLNLVTQTASQQIIFRDDSVTPLDTMAVGDDGTTQTKGKAS